MFNLLKHRLELEWGSLERFLFDFVNNGMEHIARIKLPPGTGKSYATARLPSLFPDKKFIYIVPNHDLARTVMDHLDGFGTKYVHVLGKAKQILNVFKEVIREKPCHRTGGDEYFPGCSTCNYNADKSCEWHKQFEAAARSQVIITTYHQVCRCGEGRIVIYDESPETLVSNSYVLPTHFFPSVSFGSKFKKKAGANTYTFYGSVELDEDFEIETKDCYYLDLFFKSNTNIKCCVNGKTFVLFGRTKTFLPEQYDKLIFTCATTDETVASTIFNIPMPLPDVPDLFWHTYEPKAFKTNKIKNRILKIYGGRSKRGTGGWGKNYSERSLPYVFKMFSGWFSSHDVLVITKKDFEPKIKKYLPQADVVYYGKGRGINDFNRAYDLILIYGRFGLRPLDFAIMDELGFNEQTVRDMEISEMLQCLHRGRPVTHPKTPIMVMSDSHLLDEEESVSLRAFEDYHKCYDIIMEQSLRKINIKLGVPASSGNLLRAKSYLLVRKFMDYFHFDDH